MIKYYFNILWPVHQFGHVHTRTSYFLQIIIIIIMALQPFIDPWPLSRFLILYTVVRTPWISLLPGLLQHTCQHKYRINAQSSIPRVGFEPTTRMFEGAKTVYALDCAVTNRHLYEMHFSIILVSTLRSYKWCFPSSFLIFAHSYSTPQYRQLTKHELSITQFSSVPRWRRDILLNTLASSTLGAVLWSPMYETDAVPTSWTCPDLGY
jgi:hypothetical protein